MSRIPRSEFTCHWCGQIGAKAHTRVQTLNRLGWGTQWKVCDHCTAILFDLRCSARWDDLWLERCNTRTTDTPLSVQSATAAGTRLITPHTAS